MVCSILQNGMQHITKRYAAYYIWVCYIFLNVCSILLTDMVYITKWYATYHEMVCNILQNGMQHIT